MSELTEKLEKFYLLEKGPQEHRGINVRKLLKLNIKLFSYLCADKLLRYRVYFSSADNPSIIK